MLFFSHKILSLQKRIKKKRKFFVLFLRDFEQVSEDESGCHWTEDNERASSNTSVAEIQHR